MEAESILKPAALLIGLAACLLVGASGINYLATGRAPVTRQAQTGKKRANILISSGTLTALAATTLRIAS